MLFTQSSRCIILWDFQTQVKSFNLKRAALCFPRETKKFWLWQDCLWQVFVEAVEKVIKLIAGFFFPRILMRNKKNMPLYQARVFQIPQEAVSQTKPLTKQKPAPKKINGINPYFINFTSSISEVLDFRLTFCNKIWQDCSLLIFNLNEKNIAR